MWGDERPKGKGDGDVQPRSQATCPFNRHLQDRLSSACQSYAILYCLLVG